MHAAPQALSRTPPTGHSLPKIDTLCRAGQRLDEPGGPERACTRPVSALTASVDSSTLSGVSVVLSMVLLRICRAPHMHAIR